jgi:hypothetical protein
MDSMLFSFFPVLFTSFFSSFFFFFEGGSYDLIISYVWLTNGYDYFSYEDWTCDELI